MQFKILFIDKVVSHNGFWFILFGHLLIENCLKTYLEQILIHSLQSNHAQNYLFSRFLFRKGIPNAMRLCNL